TTSAMGSFSLPLDPGVYQLDYEPPASSAVPRMTELNVAVAADMTGRLVQLPAPALVEGDVHDAMNMPLPNATVRIFEPRCAMVTPCTTRRLLRAPQREGPAVRHAATAAGADAVRRKRPLPGRGGRHSHQLGRATPGRLLYD